MKKLLPLIAFSVLLLVPVGIENAFAEPVIYATNDSALYSLDPSTGAATLIGPTDIWVMDFHPATGVLYGIDRNGNFVTIDEFSGATTIIGPFTGPPPPHYDMSFRNSDGFLFLFSRAFEANQEGRLFLVQLDGDAGSVGGASSSHGAGNAISFDNSPTLYHVLGDPLSSTTNLNTFDLDIFHGESFPLFSSRSFIGFPQTINLRVNAMDYDTVGGVMYAMINGGAGGVGNYYLGTVDLATGDVTNIGLTGEEGFDSIAVINPSSALIGGEIVPIESTSLLLAGAQSFSWMIPVTLSVLGIGIFAASRKAAN